MFGPFLRCQSSSRCACCLAGQHRGGIPGSRECVFAVLCAIFPRFCRLALLPPGVAWASAVALPAAVVVRRLQPDEVAPLAELVTRCFALPPPAEGAAAEDFFDAALRAAELEAVRCPFPVSRTQAPFCRGPLLPF